MQGALVRRGVGDLGAQVVLAAGQRVAERGVRLDEVEDLGREDAVPHQHLLDPLDVQTGLLGQRGPPVPHRVVADGADERDSCVVDSGTDPPSVRAASSMASRAMIR